MAAPKVSVNVVTYNQEAYLAETLESILAEDYPNLEIVITDDASKDGTPAIMREYAAKYPKIIKTVFSDVNTGIAKNVNRGMAACTGEYICPFAGDDLFLPGKIKAQVAVMEADPKSPMCYHNVEWFESSTGEKLRLHFEPGRAPFPTEDKMDLFANNMIPGPGVMVRRSMMEKDAYHAEFPFSSDWLHWIVLAHKGPMHYLDEVFVRYRRHSQNETLINPKIGAEQLRFVQYLRATYPDAPEEALVKAEALSWQAKAIGQMGAGQYYAAAGSFVQAMRRGRVTVKNVVVMGVCLVGGVLPKTLRVALAKWMIGQRFK